jgi:endonuclease-3
MQPRLFPNPQTDIRFIRDRLRAVFGPIRDEQRYEPIDQFIHAFIARRTHDEASTLAFLRLKQRYRSWDELADAPVGEIEATLANVTFPDSKAPNLRGALRKIRASAGSLNLEFLADLPIESALFWLEQIHDVGRKTSAATLNFSTLRKRAFVVDTHVLRMMRRFGFVGPNADEVDVYNAVMWTAIGFDADDLYELHWYLKGLGQQICTHFRAQCFSCPLSNMCMKRVEKSAVALVERPGDAA